MHIGSWPWQYRWLNTVIQVATQLQSCDSQGLSVTEVNTKGARRRWQHRGRKMGWKVSVAGGWGGGVDKTLICFCGVSTVKKKNNTVYIHRQTRWTYKRWFACQLHTWMHACMSMSKQMVDSKALKGKRDFFHNVSRPRLRVMFCGSWSRLATFPLIWCFQFIPLWTGSITYDSS